MKRLKRFAALTLAVACLLSLAAPVSAVDAKEFTDLKDHWAKSYMEDLYSRGYLTGYTDGTMRPNNTVTACETLALLSRFYHPSEVAAEYLYADYKELVESAVPAAQSWANEEIALCLAAGIVTERELKQLDLSRPIAKEYLGVCLIRAMKLTEQAANFETELTFDDTEAIAAGYRSYIALLVDIGVVTGDSKNYFNPRQGVTRAVCSTMVSRALEYVEYQKLELSLPQYDTLVRYDGLVSSLSSSKITVCGFDGIDREYDVIFDTTVAIDGKSASISNAAVGDLVQVSASDQALLALDITREKDTKYVWGTILKSVTTKAETRLYVTDAVIGNEISYQYTTTLPVTLNGATSNYGSLSNGRFVVLKVVNGVLKEASVYSKEQVVEGVITELQYGAEVTLRISGSASASYVYTFSILELPTIRRGEATISVDRLKVGDEVTVKMAGREVASITASGTMSTMTGTLTAVTNTVSGTYWTLKDEAGTEHQLMLDPGAVAKEDGKTLALTSITIGDFVSVTAYDSIIYEVVRKSATTPSNKVEGTILAVDVNSRKITLLSGSKLIYVKVNVGTTIISVTTGNTLTITTLPTGGKISAYGGFDDASNFTAVSIILES